MMQHSISRRLNTLLFAGVLACFGPVFAMPQTKVDSLMQLAEQEYAASNYTAALVIYDSLAKDLTGASLLYNIGNCHFKSGDVPRAILYYERALRIAPGDEEILANLNLAREQIVDRISASQEFSLGSTWSRLRAGADPDQWARRALWACLAFFLMLVVTTLSRKQAMKRILMGFSALVLLFTLVSVTFAAIRLQEINDRSSAVILTPKVDVRSEPRDGATVLFVLHKGTKIRVVQESNDWLEITLPNGTVGWLVATSLERI